MGGVSHRLDLCSGVLSGWHSQSTRLCGEDLVSVAADGCRTNDNDTLADRPDSGFVVALWCFAAARAMVDYLPDTRCAMKMTTMLHDLVQSLVTKPATQLFPNPEPD